MDPGASCLTAGKKLKKKKSWGPRDGPNQACAFLLLLLLKCPVGAEKRSLNIQLFSVFLLFLLGASLLLSWTRRFRRNECVAGVCREPSVEQGAFCFRLSWGVGRTTPAKRADILLKFGFGPTVVIVPCLLSLLTFFCQRRAAVASQ